MAPKKRGRPMNSPIREGESTKDRKNRKMRERRKAKRTRISATHIQEHVDALSHKRDIYANVTPAQAAVRSAHRSTSYATHSEEHNRKRRERYIKPKRTGISATHIEEHVDALSHRRDIYANVPAAEANRCSAALATSYSNVPAAEAAVLGSADRAATYANVPAAQDDRPAPHDQVLLLCNVGVIPIRLLSCSGTEPLNVGSFANVSDAKMDKKEYEDSQTKESGSEDISVSLEAENPGNDKPKEIRSQKQGELVELDKAEPKTETTKRKLDSESIVSTKSELKHAKIDDESESDITRDFYEAEPAEREKESTEKLFDGKDTVEKDIKLAVNDELKESGEAPLPADTKEEKQLLEAESVDLTEKQKASVDAVDLGILKKHDKDKENITVKEAKLEDEDVIVVGEVDLAVNPDMDSNDEMLRKLQMLHKGQENRLRQLRDSVRREDTKLVMVKKLRKSQLSKHQQSGTSFSSLKLSSGSTQLSSSNSQRGMSTQLSHYSKQKPSAVPSPSSHTTQSYKLSSSNSSSSVSSAQLQANRQFILQRQKALEQQQKARNVTRAAMTYKQRQAAAKLSLQKQPERALLEIAPPPPEITFLPSAEINEFICLVGLEQVVNKIQHLQNKDLRKKEKEREDHIPVPNVCLQCNKDFSPLWKSIKDRPGKVMCLQCVNTNQKKALKAEHTNRLKQKMQDQHQQAQIQSQASQSTSAAQVKSKNLTAAVVAAMTQLQQQRAQLKKLQEDQVRRHQKMLQRAQQQYQQQQQRSNSNSSSAGFRPPSQTRSSNALPFPFNTSSLKPEERQLLLDMMP